MWALQLIHLYAPHVQRILACAEPEQEELATHCLPPPGYKKTTTREEVLEMYSAWVRTVVPHDADDRHSKRALLAMNVTASDIINATIKVEPTLNGIYPFQYLGTCLKDLMLMVRTALNQKAIYEDSALAMQVVSKAANQMGILMKRDRAKSGNGVCNRDGTPIPMSERYPQDVDPTTGTPGSNIISIAVLKKMMESVDTLKTKSIVRSQIENYFESEKKRIRSDSDRDSEGEEPPKKLSRHSKGHARLRRIDFQEKKAFETEMGFSIYKYQTHDDTCKWCLWNLGYKAHKYPQENWSCTNDHEKMEATRAEPSVLKQIKTFKDLMKFGENK